MVEAEASGSGKRETAELAVELAHAEKRRRQNALSQLPEWLKVQEACSESACERVWQGGFYCLWHADSHSSQSQAVQSLASCALAPSKASVALTYIGVGFSTLRREWPRIDRARLDKFLSLARFLLRSLIKLCARSHWSHKRVASACRLLSKRVLLCNDKGYALGLATHITDICSEELATVAKLSSSSLHPDSELSAPAIDHFVYLFTRVLSASHDARLRTRVKHEFFQTLLDYRWSGAESEGDPPAGPMRQLELGEIASLLTDIGGDRDVHAPNRRDLYELSRLFSKAMERVSIVRGGAYKHTDNAGRIVTQLSEPRYELPHNVQTNKVWHLIGWLIDNAPIFLALR
jgi:ribosomal RNA-processing protein 1